MGQIDFTVGLVMAGLFTIAVLGFAINFAIDNSSPIDISDDPELANVFSTTGGNLTLFRSQSEDTYASIVNSTVGSGDITTISGGQFKITPVSALGITKNIMKVGYTKIFGTGSGFSVFITTFLALLTFIMGLYIWKTWGGRQPD